MQGHIGEIGATWTEIQGGVLAQIQIDGGPAASRVVGIGSGVDELDTASGTPTSADYYIEGTFHQVTALDSVRLCARVLDGDNYYAIGYNPATPAFYLMKRVGGVNTVIDTAAHDLGASNDAVVRLTLEGDQLTLGVNGVDNAPVTDADLAAAGSVGVYGGPNQRPDTTTGVHLGPVTAVG